jgi:prephenate dehydrogenase
VGLIGGSIAAALRQFQPETTVIGIGRNRARLQAAREAGLLDVAATEMSAARDCRLVIVCTPVDRIVADVRTAAAQLASGALVTDAGSVKARICAELVSGLPDGVHFVGSHPLAGSEKNGWEHSDADLFRDRVCVVTPNDATSGEACRTVESFWRSLGMRVLRMSPEDHDQALATTSHVPHVAAAAVAAQLTHEWLDLAATGFRDTTRIAAGDPDLWAAILLANRDPVVAGLANLIDRLDEFRTVIADGDTARLKHLLSDAKALRDRLSSGSGGS